MNVGDTERRGRRTLVWTVVGALLALSGVLLQAPASAASAVSFRGVNTARATAPSISLATPAGTQAGDGLLLFVSAASSSVALSTPAGWTREQTVAAGSMQTVLYSRVAPGGATVTVTSSASVKLDAQMLAYAGTDATDPVVTAIGAADTSLSASHTTPSLSTPDSWVVSFWADKSSATTSWNAPGSVVARAQSIGSGGGRLTSLSADSGDAGGAGGQTAVASAATDKATTWSVALREPGAQPPPPSNVRRWDMNEPAGAGFMLPTGPGLTGTIGDEVETGISSLGAIGYRFPYLAPNQPPAHPEHIVRIADDPSIDPGNATFTVTARMQSTRRFGNMMQKGQATAPGGQWKFQMPNGVMECLFRDSTGRTRTASSKTPVNDGQWHTISCTRSPSGVRMYVDGVLRDTRPGSTGTIDNSRPMTIGGKPDCDQIEVTCDYYVGMIDWVQITKG